MARLALSRYLNQCWDIVNWSLRNKFPWDFNRNSYIFTQEKCSRKCRPGKWRSFCLHLNVFYLVKNGLRRIIRAGSKYLIHSLAFAVMPWWRWDDWRVPQGCISVFIVSMSIKYWGSFAFYTCDKFWDSEHEICLVSLMTLTFWILDQYVHFLLQINTRKVFVFAIWMYGLNHIPKLLYWITCGTRSVNYISSSAQYRMIHVSISSLHLDISSNQIR